MTDHAATDATGSEFLQPEIRACRDQYWAHNVRAMAILTVVGLAVGLGCGVIFADRLNAYKLPGSGYPLGFWIAQQGSILVFLLIILVYCLLMNRLDARHRTELERLRQSRKTP